MFNECMLWHVDPEAEPFDWMDANDLLTCYSHTFGNENKVVFAIGESSVYCIYVAACQPRSRTCRLAGLRGVVSVQEPGCLCSE